MAILLDKPAPALLPGVYFAFPIPKTVGHCHSCQLHTILFRGNDAVAVGSHAAHRFQRGLWCFCFRKQSEFLQNSLEKQFWMFLWTHSDEKKWGRSWCLRQSLTMPRRTFWYSRLIIYQEETWPVIRGEKESANARNISLFLSRPPLFLFLACSILFSQRTDNLFSGNLA